MTRLFLHGQVLMARFSWQGHGPHGRVMVLMAGSILLLVHLSWYTSPGTLLHLPGYTSVLPTVLAYHANGARAGSDE